jgi:hypothetical protein
LDLNAKDYNGATLMHIACANGYTSILEFLLIDCQLSVESGAPMIGPSIRVLDNDGWTPLHVATFWGHQKAIEILLEHGSEIESRTFNEETVLDLCDDPDIRDFIIQKSELGVVFRIFGMAFEWARGLASLYGCGSVGKVWNAFRTVGGSLG